MNISGEFEGCRAVWLRLHGTRENCRKAYLTSGRTGVINVYWARMFWRGKPRGAGSVLKSGVW